MSDLAQTSSRTSLHFQHSSHHVHAAVEGIDAGFCGGQLQAGGRFKGQIEAFVEIGEDHLGHAATRIDPMKGKPHRLAGLHLDS